MAVNAEIYGPPLSGGGVTSVSTGLTLASGVLTADLSTGKAGGQTVIGGTAANEVLTLKGSSHATGGPVKIGSVTADAAYGLDLTDATRGNLLWGTATVKGALSYSGSGPVSIGSTTNHLLALFSNSVTHITTGVSGGVTSQTILGASATLANANMILRSDSKSWTLGNGTYASADDIFSISDGVSFFSAISTTGNTSLGATTAANTAAVLATNATAGHVLFTTCAGPPTGAAPNGSIILDTATVSGKLWARVAGAWVGIALV